MSLGRKQSSSVAPTQYVPRCPYVRPSVPSEPVTIERKVAESSYLMKMFLVVLKLAVQFSTGL